MDILSGCRLRLQANLTEQVLPGYGLIFTGKVTAHKKRPPSFPDGPQPWRRILP